MPEPDAGKKGVAAILAALASLAGIGGFLWAIGEHAEQEARGAVELTTDQWYVARPAAGVIEVGFDLRNDGAGPARDIVVTGWVLPVDPSEAPIDPLVVRTVETLQPGGSIGYWFTLERIGPSSQHVVVAGRFLDADRTEEGTFVAHRFWDRTTDRVMHVPPEEAAALDARLGAALAPYR